MYVVHWVCRWHAERDPRVVPRVVPLGLHERHAGAGERGVAARVAARRRAGVGVARRCGAHRGHLANLAPPEGRKAGRRRAPA